MRQRQWIAIWTAHQGETHAYTFYAPDHRAIASIDFRLKLMERGQPIPAQFTLYEGRLVERVAPTLSEVVRRRDA